MQRYLFPQKVRLPYIQLLILVVLTICSKPSLAYEIIFDKVSARAGLKSDYVLCVGQSTDGYIWVGTRGGLQRYDGYRMVSFYKEVPKKNQLPPRPVEQILQSDISNQMWVRTGNTVGLFNTDDFSYINIPIKGAEMHELFLYRGGRGKTYLLIKGRELLYYNARNKVFEKEPNMKEIPNDFKPSVMQLLPNGDFYLGGAKGLGYYDQQRKKFYTPANNPQKNALLQRASALRWIRLFFLDSRGRGFIQSWPPKAGQEVFLIAPGSLSPKKLSMAPMERDSYFGLNDFTENNGLIWAFGGGVFNVFDEKSSFEIFYDPKNPIYGINSSHIFQVFRDKDSNLWVATNNGLYMAFVVGNYMRNASSDLIFGNHDQTSMLEINNREFLIGSWGSGVQSFSYNSEHILSNNKTIPTQIYSGWPKEDSNYKMVWDMAIDRSGYIWFGCQHGRTIRYDRRMKKSVFSNLPLFAGQTVRTVAVDLANRIWFGTQGGKLISFYKGRYQQEADFGTIISKLFIDRRGDLWIATSGKGLIRYSTKRHSIDQVFKHKESGNSISADQITDVTQVNDSLMAVACDANLDLIQLNSGKITNMNPYTGLEQNIISSLVTDKRGYLWMSSNGGIGRFDPYKMRLRYYDQKDGMVNTAIQSNLMHISYRLGNGDLFFAGDKNFMIFNPDSLNRRFVPKAVVITGFRLFDSYVPIDELKSKGVIRLNSKQNGFTIEFSSLSYKQTKQLKYFYRLEGASDKWLAVENGQSATFASLSPGKYNFVVYAVNQEDIRSPKMTSLLIEIIPEFWQTRWFIVLVLFIFLLPMFIIYRLRVKRTVEVYRLREKVARDLHDDMGSTLTSINILSEVAKRGLYAEQEETLEYIRKIGQNSSQMMESMDDIVWSIKPDNDQLNKIMVRLREHATQLLEPQDIEYEFIANEHMKMVTLSMDSRKNLFLIYKEALNNISKYASATHVRIEILSNGKEISLTIKDNGRGFEMSSLTQGNGLINMRKRAELMNGSLTIRSAPGKGTHIALKIPT